jgi:hypothetical protein
MRNPRMRHAVVTVDPLNMALQSDKKQQKRQRAGT